MPQPKKYQNHAARQAAYRRRAAASQQRHLESRGLPPLPAIPALPGTRRWTQALEQARCLVEMVVDEMTAYFDDRSEAWQESDRAAEHQERIDQVQEVLDALSEL